MLPAFAHLPVAGSKTSAVVLGPDSPRRDPPATRTRPSASRTATCPPRALAILPVPDQGPFDDDEGRQATRDRSRKGTINRPWRMAGPSLTTRIGQPARDGSAGNR